MGKVFLRRQVKEDFKSQEGVLQKMSNQVSFRMPGSARGFTNFFRLLRNKLEFFHYGNSAFEDGTRSFDYNQALSKEVSENKGKDKGFTLVEKRILREASEASADALAADSDSEWGEKEDIEGFIQKVVYSYNKTHKISAYSSNFSKPANPARKELEVYDQSASITDRNGQICGGRLAEKVQLGDTDLLSPYRISGIVTGVLVGGGVGFAVAIYLTRYFGLWSSLKRWCCREIPEAMYQPIEEEGVQPKDEKSLLMVMSKV